MKKLLILLSAFILIFSSCKREEDHDHDHNHDTSDTTYPVITVNSPSDSTVYQNGDTVFINALVTDNDLHQGTVLIKDDTTTTEYFAQYPNVHALTSVQINYEYIVSGITQNSTATLSFTFEDHANNTAVVTRRLVFIP